MARIKNEFQTVRSEGGLLPPDLLRRVGDAKGTLPGTRLTDYGLLEADRLNEVITQSWTRLKKYWADFRTAVRSLPEGEAGTALTNDKWNLPLLRELGFGLLPSSAGPVIDDKTYPINRFFGATAIHLIGCGLSLDRRAAGTRGATTNPHGLVQEFLNRSSEHLWGIVSNGLRFRVLRDNQALSRQSFLEFDLDAMFSGDVFPDFVLLWLTAHATRFIPQTENRPESCWLEQWTKVAEEDGTRALGDLRAGVEKSLQILGEAFVSHPRNTALREALRSNQLSLSSLHGQLLRIVYRLIFLFVAEDRTLEGESLLHPIDNSPEAALARERYAAHYSTNRLRQLASRIKGSRHGDLWQQFSLLTGALYGDERFESVRKNLALPAFGSFLWNPASTANLNAASLGVEQPAELANADFLEALRHLAFTRQGKVLRPVDYKNLGAEELGGVYESLLALTPQISADGHRFTFAEFAGNERKTSGSYYTPDSLVQCLLDSALDPVVDEAIKGKSATEAEQAILRLKVCDPAVGSGHFLVGAAHRLARHLSRVRAWAQGDSEPSPLLYQHALRDVIGRCLYGVDINPMSAELCRVSLWLEALEPGKPLSFLEHHIQVGNSLLGTTPALLDDGIPDDAFTPIEGDIKARVTALKKQNKKEREEYKKGQGYLFDAPIKLGNLAAELAQIDQTPDDTAAAVLDKERRYADFVKGSAYQYGRLLADLWCAVFVWKKDDSDLGKLCPTERDFRKVESHAAAGLLPHVRAEVERLRDQYQFFHWHLAFPDVFRLPSEDEQPENEATGWSGGFDVVLGNPPWEMVEVDSIDAISVDTETLTASSSDPTHESQRRVYGTQMFISRSGCFPYTSSGRKNLYAVFVELDAVLGSTRGRLGLVVPTGVIQEDPAEKLATYIFEKRRVASVFEFQNKRSPPYEGKWFEDVHPQYRICLLTLATNSTRTAFVFDFSDLSEIRDPDRLYYQTFEEIDAFCADKFKVPMFRNHREAAVCSKAYLHGNLLGRLASGDAPAIRSGLIFNFGTEEKSKKVTFGTAGSEYLPVYEGEYIHQFNHRFATTNGAQSRYLATSELENPDFKIETADALPRDFTTERLAYVAKRPVKWIVCLRRQARSTDSLISISCVLPSVAVEGSLTAFFEANENAAIAGSLCANLNSFAANFILSLRQSGPNVNKGVYEQLPLSPHFSNQELTAAWTVTTVLDWMTSRILELTFTAWDLERFSRDCGYTGPPFRWDEQRRFLLRAELDAAFFHLYLPADKNGDWIPASKANGCPHDESPEDLARLKVSFPKPRDAVSYIMDTFPIVRRKDEEKYNGDYRTKRVILEIYDAMQTAIRTGHPYQTRLDPPPADPRVAHPAREVLS